MRYHLLPYIYSTAWDVHSRNRTFMNALLLSFPADKNAATLRTDYFFGESLLVRPVTDYQISKTSVYLPAGHQWIDFWTGETESAQLEVKGEPFSFKANEWVTGDPGRVP